MVIYYNFYKCNSFIIFFVMYRTWCILLLIILGPTFFLFLSERKYKILSISAKNMESREKLSTSLPTFLGKTFLWQYLYIQIYLSFFYFDLSCPKLMIYAKRGGGMFHPVQGRNPDRWCCHLSFLYKFYFIFMVAPLET